MAAVGRAINHEGECDSSAISSYTGAVSHKKYRDLTPDMISSDRTLTAWTLVWCVVSLLAVSLFVAYNQKISDVTLVVGTEFSAISSLLAIFFALSLIFGDSEKRHRLKELSSSDVDHILKCAHRDATTKDLKAIRGLLFLYVEDGPGVWCDTRIANLGPAVRGGYLRPDQVTFFDNALLTYHQKCMELERRQITLEAYAQRKESHTTHAQGQAETVSKLRGEIAALEAEWPAKYAEAMHEEF